MVSETWLPLTDQEGAKAFALDLVKHALNRIGVKPEVDILGFSDVLEGIKEEKYDGSEF